MYWDDLQVSCYIIYYIHVKERERIYDFLNIFLRKTYWSVRTAVTKYHRFGGLNNITLFSQFWRLEVCDQGVGKCGFFRGISPWLADGQLLAVSSWPSLSAHAPLASLCVSSYFLFIRHHPNNLKLIDYLSKSSVSKYILNYRD